MIIKESALQNNNVLNVLNSINALDEGEYTINEYMIPIVENANRGINMINLEDILRLSESSTCDIKEVFHRIHTVHGINESESAIVVNDYTLIENVELIDTIREFINEGTNVFVQPISTNDPDYVYCDNIVNEGIIDSIKDTYSTPEAQQRMADAMRRQSRYMTFNSFEDFQAHNNGRALAEDLAELIKESKGKNKSWISKKVASLRSIYNKWLNKANKESDAGKASIIKKACAAILNVIDKLLAMIERKTA